MPLNNSESKGMLLASSLKMMSWCTVFWVNCSEIIPVCSNSLAPQELVTGWERFEAAFTAQTLKPGQQMLLVLPAMKPLRHGCDVKGTPDGCPDLYCLKP